MGAPIESMVDGLVSNQENWPKGEKQPSAFKDGIFGIAFIVHVMVVAIIAALYGADALSTTTAQANANANDNDDVDLSGFWNVAGLTGVCAVVLSGLMLKLMTEIAESLVKFSLLFSVGLSFAVAFMSLAFGNIVGGILGLLFAAISVCYARMVWSRIPFATANLVTSLTAIKKNFGVTVVSYIFVVLALLWSFLWSITTLVAYQDASVCNVDMDDDDGISEQCTISSGYLFLLLVSFYWTQQVLVNIVHVTVSGVVGTWWFVPEEASSCCSSAVTSSLFRSTTYSFGSICFGSLVVALIQALEAIARQARQQGEGNQILLCLAECILSCIAGIVEYFNKWAYVYIGIYGYGYVDAGKNVISLFKARGWEAIIAEDLVGGVLSLVSLITGLVVGGIGMVVEASTGWLADAGDVGTGLAFFLSFLIGFLLCSIMLNVVASGVNAVIVLFAEAPGEFQMNHPELSSEMRMAYASAYPTLF